MRGWLSSTNRKRHQRAINTAVREVNELMKQDKEWQGRFYIHQTSAKWKIDEDGCGHLYVKLEFCDRKTGITHSFWGDANRICWINNSTLLWEMNDFVIHKVKYWAEKS